VTERGALIRNLRRVELLLHLEYGWLRRFEQRVKPSDNRHRQDHVAVLAADVHVTEHVISNVPDEVRDPVELAMVHGLRRSSV